MSVAIDRAIASVQDIIARIDRASQAAGVSDTELAILQNQAQQFIEALNRLDGEALERFTNAHPAEVPAARKHEISNEFVDAMNDMEAGKISLADYLALVDEIERNDPGDARQKRFYAAMRELAQSVADKLSKATVDA